VLDDKVHSNGLRELVRVHRHLALLPPEHEH
jgi:hypothetical protein